MIDEQEILELIGVQLQSIISSDADTYGGYQFVVTSELQFIKDKKSNSELKNNPKQIFIVIKALPATLNFGQVLMPMSFNAIAEQGKVDICKKLLTEYAETYNLQVNADGTIRQYYSTPYVLSNFNEVGNGYRSLLTMTATFQISENANRFDVYYVLSGVSTKLDAISQSIVLDAQMETQTFYNTDGYTKSRGVFGTRILNLTMYLTTSDFLNLALAIFTGDAILAPNGVDTDFTLNVKFKNNYEITNAWRLRNLSIQENIGELSVVSLTFTN